MLLQYEAIHLIIVIYLYIFIFYSFTFTMYFDICNKCNLLDIGKTGEGIFQNIKTSANIPAIMAINNNNNEHIRTIW